jgi:hypothetical protein
VAPYSRIWSNAAAGVYALTAVVTDNLAQRATSTPVNVMVVLTQSWEAWKAWHFTAEEMAHEAISGPGADPEGDGLGNLAEYALGLNPKLHDAGGAIGAAVEGGYLTLRYRRAKPVPADVVFAVESVGDMGGVWGNDVTQVAVVNHGTSETVTVRDNVPVSGADKRFMRLRVSKQ